MHSILCPSDGADGDSPSKGMNPALFMSRLGETHMLSIGIRERLRLNVYGGDLDGCVVKMASRRSFSRNCFVRLFFLTSSFMSIPMMMLSPLSIHFFNSVMRSLLNISIRFGVLIWFSSLKYLHCCDHTVLIPLLLHGRYDETIVMKVVSFPLSLFQIHLPRPVLS